MIRCRNINNVFGSQGATVDLKEGVKQHMANIPHYGSKIQKFINLIPSILNKGLWTSIKTCRFSDLLFLKI